MERKFTLIPDAPSESDLFNSRCHKRCARALSDSVQKLSDQDGAIGLEGGWGSGKSSVINFAKSSLAENKTSECEFHVFTFDLWAHGNEDIRGSLLEEFTGWASDQFDLAEIDYPKHDSRKQNAKDFFLNKIRGRVETIDHTTDSEYGKLAASFICLAPVLPLLTFWLSPFAARLIFGTKDLPASGASFWVACVFSVLSFLFLFGFYTSLFVKWVQTHSLSKTVSFFQKQVETETTTRTFSREQPKTVEFQSIFRELLRLIQQGGTRVVIVLDNIDRLPPDRIPEVWAEVRSVFSAVEVGRDPSLKDTPITVIVPYDFDYVVASFEGAEDGDVGHAESTVKKTFQSVIRVTPPISTDWKAFLFEKLDGAVKPALAGDEKFRLFRMFDLLNQQQGRLPTPRDIITYVNDIVVYAQQWHEAIKLEYIALFVLHKRKLQAGDKIIEALKSIDESMLAVSGADSDYGKYLAALLFNVEPECANQVLLEPQIKRNLTQGKGAGELAKLSEVDGFEQVLLDVLRSDLGQIASESSAKYARAVENFDSFKEQISSGCQTEALRYFDDAGQKISTITLKNPVEATLCGLAQAVAAQPESRRLKLAEHFSSAFAVSEELSEGDASTIGQRWMGAHLKLSKAIESDKLETRFLANLETASPSAGFCLGAILAIEEFPETDFTFDQFEHSVTSDELSAELSKWVDSRAGDVYPIIRHGAKMLKTTEATTVAVKIIDIMGQPASKEPDVCLPLTHSLVELCCINTDCLALAQVKAFTQSGMIIWHMGEAIEQEEWGIAADLLWLIAQTQNYNLTVPNNGQYGNLGAIGNRATAYTDFMGDDVEYPELFLERFNELMVKVEHFSDLQEHVVSSAEKDGLLPELYRFMVKKGDFGKLKVDYIPVNYAEIKQLLGAELSRSLLTKLQRWHQSFVEKIGVEKCFEVSPLFLEDVHEWKLSKLEPIGAFIDEAFNGYSEDEWLEFLKNPGERKIYFLTRRKTNDYRPSPQILRGAIVGYAEHMLTAKQIEEVDTTLCAEVLAALHGNTRKVLPNDLLVRVPDLPLTAGGVLKFVEAFSEIACDMIKRAEGDAMLDNFICPLISTNDDQVKALLGPIAKDAKRYIASTSEESRGRLEEAVSAVESGDPELVTWLRENLELPHHDESEEGS